MSIKDKWNKVSSISLENEFVKKIFYIDVYKKSICVLTRNGSNSFALLIEVILIRIEDNKELYIVFPGGCKTAMVSKIFDKIDKKTQFNFLVGLSNELNFMLFNLDSLLTWKEENPKIELTIPERLMSLPKWSYPRKISFHKYTEEDKGEDKNEDKGVDKEMGKELLRHSLAILNKNCSSIVYLYFHYLVLGKLFSTRQQNLGHK